MKNFKDVNILLYGTGAVGGLYGGKLAQAGAMVSVVCRSDYDEVAANGIFIKSVSGDFHFKPQHVVRKGSDYSERPDFVIVSVKSLPEINIIDLIKNSVYPETAIVLLQNGINNEQPVSEYFSNNEIIGGLAFVCASRTAYGQVNHIDYGRVVFGTYPSGISEKVRLLVDMLISSGIPAEAESDIIAGRWKKLLWNAPFNPLSVICGGADTSQMMRDEHVRELSESVMREILSVAEADGHPLPEVLVTKNIEDTVKMKPYKTSMLLDYEARRPMEVEAILGNVTKMARQYNVSVPYLQTLYAILGLLNIKNISSD